MDVFRDHIFREFSQPANFRSWSMLLYIYLLHVQAGGLAACRIYGHQPNIRHRISWVARQTNRQTKELDHSRTQGLRHNPRREVATWKGIIWIFWEHYLQKRSGSLSLHVIVPCHCAMALRSLTVIILAGTSTCLQLKGARRLSMSGQIHSFGQSRCDLLTLCCRSLAKIATSEARQFAGELRL